MSMIRLSSNGVPSKSTAGGKNSSSDGPWNSSPGSSADGAIGSPARTAGSEERYEVRELRAFS
jgi:hypothetical protein